MSTFLRAVLVTALFACLVFRPDAGAAQGQATPVRAVFCDTAEQVEALLKAVVGDGAPYAAALKVVNDEAGKVACGPGTFLIADPRPVRGVVVGGRSFGIVRGRAIGAVMGLRLMRFPPADQFYAEEGPKADRET